MDGGAAIDHGLTPVAVPTRTWQDECGVVGVWRHPRAAEVAHLALFALQHRGEESAGIATVDGTQMYAHRGMGLVGEALPASEVTRLGAGHSGIGHVRYSTAGASQLTNAQPLVFAFQTGNLAFAHNGNLTNAPELRGHLEAGGAIFHTSSDTEVVAHLTVRRGPASVTARLRRALALVQGGYALCVLADDRLLAARDPHGLRPLALGRLDDAWMVASESCAFDIVGAEFVRDVEPGELLAAEHPCADADVVIGVPDSSIAAAMGYAHSSGITYDLGLVKSHYVGRTFIQPSQAMRERGVRLKLNPLRHVVAGKRVVLVDDSLVRGTTSRRIVGLLRDAGAREVHVRIASPPVTHSCHFGIDTAHRSELIAASHSVEEIRAQIGADSLAFLSVGQLERAFDRATGAPRDVQELQAVPERAEGFCNACFTGHYPEQAARPCGAAASTDDFPAAADTAIDLALQELLA